LFRSLGNRLLTGIVFAIPLVVTYWVLSFGYGVVKGLSDPWLQALGVDFPGAGFVITILAFIGLGFRRQASAPDHPRHAQRLAAEACGGRGIFHAG
jgi:Uncharacterized conserved protein